MTEAIHILSIEDAKHDFFVKVDAPQNRREYSRKDALKDPKIIPNKSAWVKRAESLPTIRPVILRPKSLEEAAILLRQALDALPPEKAEVPRIITLVGHARPGLMGVGSGEISDAGSVLDSGADSVAHFRDLRPYLDEARGDRIQLFGCAVSIGEPGQILLFALARATRVSVSGAMGSVWWGDLSEELLTTGVPAVPMRGCDTDNKLELVREIAAFESFQRKPLDEPAPSGAKILAVRRNRRRSLSSAAWSKLRWAAIKSFPFLADRYLDRSTELEESMFKSGARDASGQMFLSTADVLLKYEGRLEEWALLADESALVSPLKDHTRTLFFVDRAEFRRAEANAFHL